MERSMDSCPGPAFDLGKDDFSRRGNLFEFLNLVNERLVVDVKAVPMRALDTFDDRRGRLVGLDRDLNKAVRCNEMFYGTARDEVGT